ncbi:MAG: hypothetical protein JJ974_09760 [Phycisphaerales bacterium]|nr:hypothetical protein [Phycisphaerales bacterium]
MHTRIQPGILQILTLITAMFMMALAVSATAQPVQTPTPTLTELDPDPITIESIGLSLNLPVGGRAETVRIGNTTSTGISLPDGLGTIIVKEQRTSNESLTAQKAAESIRDQLMNLPGAMVIAEQPELRVGIWSGHRFYVRTPPTQAGGAPTYRGISIFGLKPKTFLIFDLTMQGSESSFQNARAMYETSIATMNLQEMSSESLKRIAGFKLTKAFIEQLTIEDYDAILTGKKSERWERLYTPAPSGDEMDATEHGYRRIKSWSGYKGEMGSKERSKWSQDDRKLGYLIQLDSMALDSGLRIDSRALYFMSLDGNEELWTIRMTLKGNDPALRSDEQFSQVSSVTGARVGGKLTVTTAEGNEPPTTVTPFIPEEGYITQVQSYLMGSLLAHKQLQGDFASYAYNPVSNSVTLRWDIAEQPSSSPGLWNITTKTSPESPPTTTQFDARGDLMRVRLTGNRLWEPITLERLLALWKRKGLPI